MDLAKAVFLGILQGLTEFLPVSSSGHLVLGNRLVGLDLPGNGFEVFAHAGTLLAVMLYFRKEILLITVSALCFRRDREGRLALYIVLATIPTAVVALTFKARIDALFEHAGFAAAFLLVTGVILLLTRFARVGDREPGLSSSLAMGVAQSLALIPGISRSGATISTGMFLGVEREQAARFSFLLAIPALIGATILELGELPGDRDILFLFAAGAVAAFVAGLLTIHWFLRLVARGRLHWFGWYCLAAGTVALALLA